MIEHARVDNPGEMNGMVRTPPCSIGRRNDGNCCVSWSNCLFSRDTIPPNLISLLVLSGVLIAETKHFLWNRNLDDEAEGGL